MCCEGASSIQSAGERLRSPDAVTWLTRVARIAVSAGLAASTLPLSGRVPGKLVAVRIALAGRGKISAILGRQRHARSSHMRFELSEAGHCDHPAKLEIL